MPEALREEENDLILPPSIMLFMKKIYLPVALLLLVLASCTNADPKKMAGDVCNCMDPAMSKLSSKSKKIIKKALKSDDTENTIQEEVTAIEDEDERTQVTEEIGAWGKALQSQKLQTCLADIDKKYKVKKSDEKKLQKQIATEMEGQCELGAYVFKYAIKQNDQMEAGNDGDEDSKTENTDKPTKRKASDEKDDQ